jgi:hypothetical protein
MHDGCTYVRLEAGQEDVEASRGRSFRIKLVRADLHSFRGRIGSRVRFDWFAKFRRLQIVCRGFPGALIGDDLIGDLLPFIQAAQNGQFDRADMNEHIGAAGVGLDGPEAFRRIEPSHCARRHGALSNRPTNLAEPLFIARRGVGNRRYGCCRAAGGRASIRQ